MRRATSLIHTSEIKILLNLPLIILVLIFVNVKALTMLMLFLEQTRGHHSGDPCPTVSPYSKTFVYSIRTDVVNQTLKISIPTKMIPSKSSKPWLNHELKSKTKNINHKLLCNKFINLIQRKIKLAKQSYNMSFISKVKPLITSQADYWSLLNKHWKPSKQYNYPLPITCWESMPI